MPRLLKTMAAYGVLWTASDITQELVVSRKNHVDWSKTARIATTGTCVMAPLMYNWIHFAERLFPGSSMKMILKKVIAEQICFAPIAITSFYSTTSILEGKPVWPELKSKYKQTFLVGLCYWPFAQMLNFRFVPHHYKPLAVACFSFVWTIFLCFMKEDNGSKQGEKVTPKAVLLEDSARD
ncbi:mpv17-like protein isoform X2 [Babylonia areolata]